MDTYEATKVVMSRIQSLDPDNSSKIMGYILIQDQGEKEMIRLAFGPESLLLSYINKAKAFLGLSSTSNNNNNNNNNNHPPPFLQGTTPRILVPNNNGFHHFGSNPSSPFQRSSPRPISYASVLNSSSPVGAANNESNNGSGSSSSHFYGSNEFGDEFFSGQVHDQLQFLDDSMVDPIMSPSGRSDSLVFPYGEDANGVPSPHPHHPFHHRRSCSVNDVGFLSNMEEMGGGFGWRPCMYYARGFCKNGASCKFLHSDGEGIELGGSPNNTGGSGFEDLMRLKALQQQRLALMATGSSNPFTHNKCSNFLNDNFRNDFSPLGFGGCASANSRQIYLTFPADSTFKEEDVSGYFSMFGPVQDVRIPYQQKRMFGFVTFVYPETVKLILAKGNPHFVCDSRVLVKPYKEKGKVLDKKQHQNLERGEYSACLSPSGVDSREHFDNPFGSRMLINSQEMMLRRKLEQEAELQHAIELQGRRMMNLQLMNLKSQHHSHLFLPNSPVGAHISSPRPSQFLMNQNIINHEISEDFDGKETANSQDDEKFVLQGSESSINNPDSANKQHDGNDKESDFPESLEHVLPDNLFSSPTKLAAERQSIFYPGSSVGTDESIPVTNTLTNNTPGLPISSPLGMASVKSACYQMPRKVAIEM